MDKLMLRFILFFVKTFAKKDVDFERLKIITETKLITDRRRVRVTMKTQKENAEPKNQLLITQIVYAVFGIMIAALLAAVDEILLGMVLFHSYLLFMMAMTLITDFSTVILDTADNQVILPRPVSARTLFISRLVHILVYLLQFTLALALVPLISIFFLFGPAVGITAIFTVALTVAFAVFLTYLLYGLIIRFANEQKLKDIISWFQIFMTIFFAVGYQIVPRLVNIEGLKMSLPLHAYAYFLPPVWMAMSLQAVQQLHFDSIHLAMIACAVLFPILTFWIMVKFLAPAFTKKLSAMSGNFENYNPSPVGKVANSKPLSSKLSGLIATNKTEQAGFDLTWRMTARDKGFKMAFYPSLAYLAVFAFIFVFKSGKNFEVIWATLGSTKLFLWFIYLPMFTISSAISLIAYNENFTASWIYLASPLRKPGSLISGALKALLTKFFLPVTLILFAFSVYIWGYSIIDDFLLGFINNIIIALILSHIGSCYLPFSMQPGIKQQSGKFVKMILQAMLIAAIVGLHYLAMMKTWIVPALIPVAIVGCFLLFRSLQNYSWQKISTNG